MAAASSPTDVAEVDLWHGTYSAKAMVAYVAGAVMLTAAALVAVAIAQAPAAGWAVAGAASLLVWLWIGLVLAYRKLSVEYSLSNQRFIHRSGILRRSTNQIEVIDMDDISYHQGLIERFVDVGTIRITSSDRTHPELELAGIDHVQQVAQIFDQARRQERMRRGIHIETI